MVKTTIIVLIILGVMLISGLSFAKYKGFCNGPEGKADWLANRVSKQLELDDHQQQQLSQFRDKTIDLMHNMRNENPHGIDQALQLLDSSQLDRDQAYQMWDTKHNWIAAAGPQLIDAFADFSDSLNEEQRTKLQTMIMRHRQHRHCCESPSSAVQE